MPVKLPSNTSNSKKVGHALLSLRANERGTVAVMMGFLFPVLIGAFGLGFEVSNWYLRTRSMQNAADAAAIAAATNGSSNYNTEAGAVATQYGYTNGTNNVTVAASNTAPCPAGYTAPCYSVTISSMVPLYLTEVLGYQGNSVLNGAREQTLTASAIANKPVIQQPICLLGLDTTGTAVRSNGGPSTNFTGCTVMSDSAGTCNGSNLQATMGLAHATNNGCGIKGLSYVPVVPDPYAYMASNIPADLPTRCSNTYPQESKHGSTWSGGTTWSGSKTLSGTASLATNTLICGDLRLTGDLSHYVVGREFAWPISDENHRLMQRIIDQCWGFHGRVASREQIQVQLSFAHQREWLDLFLGWWEYGFRAWRKRAPPDGTLTFLCELGPKEYAMTGADGYELSDRWQEAQMLMRLVRELWSRIEREDAAIADDLLRNPGTG